MIKNLIVLLLLSCSIEALAFEKYAYAPIRQFDFGYGVQKGNLNDHLNKIGYKKIKVIYHDQFLDKNNQPDPQKIKKIAEAAKTDMTPVSFDYEKGNYKDYDNTISAIQKTIGIYKKHGGKAPVGVYGVFPQNTFGGGRLTEKRQLQYQQLNEKYSVLLNELDFISPVFYNYDKNDLKNWEKSVNFSLSEIRKYNKANKKVYPYITASYFSRRNGVLYAEQISEIDLKNKLDYLKSRTDGVIFWESGASYNTNGKRPTFYLKSGWGRVLSDFSKGN